MTTAPCYLHPKTMSTEFMMIDGELLCYRAGKGKHCYSYDDIPEDITVLVKGIIQDNPKYQEGLKRMCGSNSEAQIFQFLKCRFSGNDQYTDFTATGEINEEFINCKYQGHCAGERFICKQNDYNLTITEVRIIRLVVLSLADKQIADRLNISQNTVQNHLKNIHRKLGTVSKVGIACFAKERNII